MNRARLDPRATTTFHLGPSSPNNRPCYADRWDIPNVFLQSPRCNLRGIYAHKVRLRLCPKYQKEIPVRMKVPGYDQLTGQRCLCQHSVTESSSGMRSALLWRCAAARQSLGQVAKLLWTYCPSILRTHRDPPARQNESALELSSTKASTTSWVVLAWSVHQPTTPRYLQRYPKGST